MQLYSPGKLLITAEYAVLDGAKALALPTKLGQSMEVEPAPPGSLKWEAFSASGHIWFEAELLWEANTWVAHSQEPKAQTLQKIFNTVQQMRPKTLNPSKGYRITTKLEFPNDWGLGSSSTLINNIATWTVVDAYALQDAIFGGSGYDIAAAQASGPILYQRTATGPKTWAVSLDWPFTQQLYFLHLKQKQNSRESIYGYRQRETRPELLEAISQLTDSFVACRELDGFTELIELHEAQISRLTGLQPIKQLLFPDFDGHIKSLGGWGGDLVLVASKTDPSAYFQEKGYPTLLAYHELIP